ncbi:VOC family protein [Sphingobium sp. AP50]|nr:VOC family protein [Sphingobium sp. AP50]
MTFESGAPTLHLPFSRPDGPSALLRLHANAGAMDNEFAKETEMKFKFHHMNLCTDNLPRLTKFYSQLFSLGAITDEEHTVISRDRADRAYTGAVDFLTDGDIEFHWAERDLDTGFKMNASVNPMGHGHFCFRTDDIKGFMKRCDEMGIRYSDYGCWAIPGWYQVFLQDPDGHVIEVHQPGIFNGL